MKKILTRLNILAEPSGGMLGGITRLVGGATVSQFIVLASTPILTRLYSPEQFGVLAIYMSLVGLMSVICCLRYELAIPMPELQSEANDILRLCYFVLVLMISFLVVTLVVSSELLPELLNSKELAVYQWLLPVGVFVAGAHGIVNYYSTRQKNFKGIAVSKVYQSLIQVALQLSFFFSGTFGLLLGVIFGQSVAAAYLFRGVRQSVKTGNRSKISIVSTAEKYLDFPKYSAPAALINSAGIQMTPLIISSFTGPAVAGMYALANRVTIGPSGILGSAVSTVFVSEAPTAHRDGSLGVLAKRLHTRLSFVAAFPAVFLAMFGPEVFGLVFGNKWVEAGEMSKWLALPLYAGLVTSPISTIFTVAGQQRLSLVFQALLTILRLVPLLAGILLFGVYAGVIAFSIGGFIGYMVYNSKAFQIAGADPRIPVTRAVVDSATAGLCLLPLFVAVQSLAGLTVISAAALLSGGLYALIGWKRLGKTDGGE